jgi:hypothetical protein
MIVWSLFIIGHMGLFVYTQKGSIVSMVDLPTTEIIEPNNDPLKHIKFIGGDQVFPYDLFIEKILLIEPYYIGAKRRSFIYAMLQLFKNPNFEFTEFLQKLKCQPTALVDCANTTQYVSLIEEIYNYRRREKVNLRY